MIWIFISLIIIVSVGVISYPLFWNNLQVHRIKTNDYQDFGQAEFWLTGLSDLEDDFQLGRISENEYQNQKIVLQRGYLESTKNQTKKQ